MAITLSGKDSATEYEWKLNPAYVPPHIKNLPEKQGFSLAKILRFQWIVVKGVLGVALVEFFLFLKLVREGKIKFQRTADLGLAEGLKLLNKWNKIEDLDDFFQPWTSFEKPKVANTWTTDAEFARERIYGINPAFIRKCKAEDLRSDGNFPVTDAIISGLLPQGSSLATELANSRLYIMDYKILADIITNELEDQLGKYPLAPLCLLHVNQKDQLMPLAIRLQQGNSFHDLNKNPIFTHQSSPENWLTAKMAVSSADIAYQGIVSHLMDTHLIIETFAVASYRQLSPQHIVLQILQSHFFNTFAINEMARGIFLGHEGFFDVTGALGFTGSNELLRRAYTGSGKNYQGEPHIFYRRALPIALAARDVADLPNYYYRDDAITIWDAIQTYVTDILRLYYKSKEDLVNDAELQAWKNELVSPEFGRIQGLLSPEKSAQITGSLTELNDLIAIITNVIFTATAQHSAVNFSQYEYASWVPNMPFATYQPFNDLLEKQQSTVNFIDRLPNRLQSFKQIVLVKALSMPVPLSSESLLTMANPFKDEAARKVFQDFQKVRLRKIEEQIIQRNASVEYPYVRLLPSQIAQSIAI
ncbi:MAG: lipoxygenase family protein [Nostoc sp.]|uniref:lipoxygenase family protein n=1 Tax=Nostoc sp. TaxID=1180 RepID=UPI002FF66D0C